MICLRCIRVAASPLHPAASILRQAKPTPTLRFTQPQQQSKPLSTLSRLPTRPILALHPQTATTQPPIAADTPTSSLLRPLSQPSLLQVRGAKRDTFNPSHVVRKRRHGFLARLRSRTGRKVLARRKAKGRNTLSH
ncbi:hypothetical protein LTR08_009079 [Meristemomyces frigidus]|nr:hypothetical protein LTR08_009079 [Meristemomyces frigidus]